MRISKLTTILPLLLAFTLSACSVQREVPDPLEPVNRKIFWANEKLDEYVLEPAARGYDWALPGVVKKSVSNFFLNLRGPQLIVSDLVQGKACQAGDHVTRFLLNSTIGVVGLFDVAKEFGIEHHNEDFGIALAYHGIGTGPYLVLPILGPSNGRDLIGRIVDGFLDPVSYVDPFFVQAGLRVTNGVDQRRRLIDAIDVGHESSLDYYTFVQSSYQQSRLNDIYDEKLPPELRDPDAEGNEPNADDEGWSPVEGKQ